MTKFELLGIEMSTKISVIPLTAQFCVSATKALEAQDRIFEKLDSLLHEPSLTKETKGFIRGIMTDLSLIHDFVYPIVGEFEGSGDPTIKESEGFISAQ